MTQYSVDPSDLAPGNYIRTDDGSEGQILPDLDCLHPNPCPDRPEEYIAVAWDDGARTICHLGQIVYAGQRKPEAATSTVEEYEVSDVPGSESEVIEGLTFADWLDRAGRTDSASQYDLRAAWRAGEAPEDYAV